MWVEPPEVEWRSIGPLKCCNYALLKSVGLGHVFDTMRYEQAYLARKSDIDAIIASSKGDYDFVKMNFSLLLAKPNDKVTQRNWWPQRLLSRQSFEFIYDHATLYVLCGDNRIREPLMRLKTALKWRGEFKVTDTLANVLRIMYENEAFPAYESDSGVIDQGFYSPDEPITVTLSCYSEKNNDRRVNLKPKV